MFFVKEKSAVYECIESYLAHELANLRAYGDDDIGCRGGSI